MKEETLVSFEAAKNEAGNKEKIDFDKLDLSVPENLATCSMAVAGVLSEGMLNDPNFMNQHRDNLDLAWRNIAVLGDRIESGVITQVSEENLSKLSEVESRTQGLLQACGKKINEGGPLHTMQHEFYSQSGMPDGAAWLMASLLKSATESFADIISDSKIDDKNLIGYFAGNTRPNVRLVVRKNDRQD